MKSKRRERTNHDSDLRESQIREAKFEAAKFINSTSLHQRDQSTHAYIKAYDSLENLKKFYERKQELIYTRIRDLGLNRNNYANFIIADVDLNYEKDGISSIEEMKHYRRRQYNFIMKGKLSRNNLDIIQDKSGIRFDFNELDESDHMSMSSSALTLYKNHKTSLDRLTKQRNLIIQSGGSDEERTSIAKRIRNVEETMERLRNIGKEY